MSERRAATTIGELDIHLSNVQDALRELRGAVSNMATRDDIEAIAERLDEFATKEELRMLESRLIPDTVPGVVKRAGAVIVWTAAAIAAGGVVIGALVAIARFFDKFK